VLAKIQSIANETLEPNTVYYLGASDVEPLLRNWNQLQRCVASAKLAIIREEFAVRFPNYFRETGSFTFGIHDPVSDSYVSFLKPRKSDDGIKLALQIVADAYPPSGFFRKWHPSGAHQLYMYLYKDIVAYAQGVEAMLDQYYKSAGGTTHD